MRRPSPQIGLTIPGEACDARADDCRCSGEHSIEYSNGYYRRRVTHHCGVPGCGGAWRSRLTEATFDPIRLPNLAPHR